MIYKATITITKVRSEYIKKCLRENILTEDETILESMCFDNGNVLDVKCCGADNEPAWTEAVLFSSNGKTLTEVCCSEVSDEFLGEWELEYNGDTYIVEIKEE